MDSCIDRSSAQTCAKSFACITFSSPASILLLLLSCCVTEKKKKEKRKEQRKKMRKSISEHFDSSSVPGQIFSGSCEKLWTLLAISDRPVRWDKAKWFHCGPCPTDLVSLQLLPWETFTSGEVSQAHQGEKHLSVHASDSQNKLFVLFWKTILAPLISTPTVGLPAACLAVRASATPSLGSATCSPCLWMLPPP